MTSFKISQQTDSAAKQEPFEFFNPIDTHLFDHYETENENLIIEFVKLSFDHGNYFALQNHIF